MTQAVSPIELSSIAPPEGIAGTELATFPGHGELGAVALKEHTEYSLGFENGFAMEAPTFRQQLQEAKEGSRRHIVMHQPSSVDERGEWRIAPSTVPLSEGEMLSELDMFLGASIATAERQGDSEAATRAQNARENITFIGHTEFETAAHGLAEYWTSYLQADPQNKVAVFSPGQNRAYKSADFTIDAVLSYMDNTDSDILASGRVQLIGSDAATLHDVQPDHTKVILLDDWSSAGAMIRADAREVAKELRRSGNEALIDSMEANFLVAREDQLANPPQFIDDDSTGSRRTLPIKAYYKAKSYDEAGMYVFGAHSSVDYNDAFLRHLAELQATELGKEVALPSASLIERPYNR